MPAIHHGSEVKELSPVTDHDVDIVNRLNQTLIIIIKGRGPYN